MESNQALKKDKSHDAKTTKAILIALCVIFVIAILAVVIWRLMQGTETTTGDWAATESNDSLTCEVNNMEYPFFEYDNATKKNTKVNVIFDNADKLSTISLKQTMYYDSASEINASEAFNHAAMNISFQNNGLGADAFNATYTLLEDSMRMSLYANASKINGVSVKYFLLDQEGGTTNYNLTTVQKIYEDKGFKCTVKDN